MAPKIPLYAEPDPNNPGKALIKEIPAGEVVDGMFPTSVLSSHSVASTDGASNPRGGAVGENQLVGRSGPANVQGLTLADVKAILQVVRGSAGVQHARRMIELDDGGKLSLTMFPASILDAQANQGESVSSGNTTPPPSGFANIYKAVVDGIMQLRGIISETPNRIQISETPFDAVIDVVTDDSGSDPGALYSAGHIDQLLADLAALIQTADLVSDETPELGGDLDLKGNAIRQNIGDNDEVEVLRIEDSGPEPVLFLMGMQAVLALLDDPQEDDELRWSESAGAFVNRQSEALQQQVAADRFEARLLAHHNLSQDVEEGLPFADAAISIASSHWAPAANEGGGVNFERVRYAPADSEDRTYKITFQISLENTEIETPAQVRFKVAKWNSTNGARGDLPGSTRYMDVTHRQSLTIVVETVMAPDTEVGVMALHSALSSEAVKFLADACTIKIEEVKHA